MSYNDYKAEVKKLFTQYNPKVATKDIDAYFNSADTDDIIREDYEQVTGKNLGHISPSSTAYCLTMLY